LNLFKGHTGPVTSLAFYAIISKFGKKDILITGSWDNVGIIILVHTVDDLILSVHKIVEHNSMCGTAKNGKIDMSYSFHFPDRRGNLSDA
jgi:hypothetical protein